MPPAQIIFHILAKEFGKFPWEVEDAPLSFVLQAWMIHTEMMPKEVRGGR